MNSVSPALPSPTEPSLSVAERQLTMLGEMAHMGMVVTRAYAHAAVAASHAVEVILADDYWQPETGRARALAGAKDAADAFQKTSRSLRLTLVLEAATADTVRDLRAGIIPERKVAAIANACPASLADGAPAPGVERPDSENEPCEPHIDRHGREIERLVEFDRPDRPHPAGFRPTVNALYADIGACVDWETETLVMPILDDAPLKARPAGWSEHRPHTDDGRRVRAERETALSP